MLHFVLNVKRNLKKIGILVVFFIGVFLLHSFFVTMSSVVVKNSGISFGIKINLFFNLLFFLVFFLPSFYSKNKGLLFILLGGVSNLVDRLLFGYVRDYWPLPMLNIYNNLNDWLITIGVIVFIIGIWKKK